MKRTPTARPLNINDERHLGLLRDDWVRVSFIDYAHQALAEAEVTGLRSGSPDKGVDSDSTEEAAAPVEGDGQ